MYVCLCKGVRESDVKQAASCGKVRAEDLVEAFDLSAKDCCGRCARNINRLVTIAEAHVTEVQEMQQVRFGAPQ